MSLETTIIDRLTCFAHTLQLTVKDGLNKLSSATSVLSKCSKLSNLFHQRTKFNEAFEEKFGQGRSIPKMNATRWNSHFHQLSSIANLDAVKLSDLVKSTDHSNLVLNARDNAVLKE